MGRLDGKVALITGAAGGLGSATALRLADEGARVAVTGRRLESVEPLAEEIAGRGGSAIAVELDVAEEAAWEAAVARTVAELGGLHVLHNNAAWTSALHLDVEMADLDVDTWDRVMAINLRGTALGCKHAVRHMLTAGGGSIINMGSNAGLRGNTNLTAYGASKAAISFVTQSVAVAYGPQNIRCNLLSPGFLVTPGLKAAMGEEQFQALLDTLPSPRLGLPEDLAAVVAHLASDDAAFISGQVIAVDGGQLCYLPQLAPFPPVEAEVAR